MLLNYPFSLGFNAGGAMYIKANDIRYSQTVIKSKTASLSPEPPPCDLAPLCVLSINEQ